MKLYLGDGVYATFDGWAIWLTTENGIEATNTIVLEVQVIQALEKFVAEVRAELARKAGA